MANQYALRTQIAADLPAIIEVLKGKALEGDTTAARVLLDRSLSPLKATDDPVRVSLGDTPADSARLVLEAVGRGELTPDQGATLLGGIGAQVRILEAGEILSRLAKLEEVAYGLTGPAEAP